MTRIGISLAVLASLAVTPHAYALTLNGTGDPLSASALAGANQITFDDVAKGDFESEIFAELKVTGLSGNYSVGSLNSGKFNTTGKQSLYNLTDLDPQGIRFDFIGGTNAFAFNMGGNNGIWVLEAFDEDAQPLESQIIGALYNSNAGDYFGLSSNTAIAFAILSSQNDITPDSIYIDNVTFGPAAVSAIPVPGTFSLALFGLAGLLGTRLTHRKRRRKMLESK